ncbi:MAG: hypothetical protein AB1633_10220, partial [Elusimicrobiota bacterium]
MFEETRDRFLKYLEGLYNGTNLFIKTLIACFQKPFEMGNTVAQMYEIGARSLPVSVLTSL